MFLEIYLQNIVILVLFFLSSLTKFATTEAGRGSRVDSTFAYCAGGLPIVSQYPTSATYVACRERDWLPCWPPRGQQVLHQR